MGKVIDLAVEDAPVVWFIDIDKGLKEHFGCEYKEAGASRVCRTAHWVVVAEAPTVDRLCIMLKKAEKELAAKRRAAGPTAGGEAAT